MASHTVTDPGILERKCQELWRERARLLKTLHAVEREITDLGMGVVHEPHDRDRIPDFALIGDSVIFRSDPGWLPAFVRRQEKA